MVKFVLTMLFAVGASLHGQALAVSFYDGSGALQYICENTNQTSTTTSTWRRSDSTLTSVVISSNVATYTTATAHQLYAGARVTNTGSTSGVIDGTFTASITAADATHTTSTIAVTTTAPLLNALNWSITHIITVSSKVISAPTFGSPQKNLACSNRANY